MNKALTSKRILQTGAESILESISDGVFTVDADWRTTSFNRAAEAITGIRRRDAIGKTCSAAQGQTHSPLFQIKQAVRASQSPQPV